VRIKFTGPAGAQFQGKDLRGIRFNQGRLEHLAEIQRATGLKMPALIDEYNGIESVGTRVVLFLTLRNAGFAVTWEQTGGLTDDDFEQVPEPGDLPPEPGDSQEPVDPTPARTGSVPGDDAPPHAASRASSVKSSKRRSPHGS